jgi:diguanylate cyclase (GGDEF)-like protein
LGYLDLVGGPGAVATVLHRCGLEDCERELRDENSWFSWETKIALFEAAARVLGNPEFMDEMAAYWLDASVAGGHKVALRTLGSPQFVLRNIAGANARFNRSHLLELLDLGDGHALVRFSEIGGGHRYHRLDCDYTAAMLALIPGLFGLGAAHVSHIQCAADGADACLFEMHWTERPHTRCHAVAAAAATAVGLTAAAVLAPVALPFVAAAGLIAGGLLVREREHWRAEQMRHLERQVHDSEQVTQRLLESLQDVVSDLRLEEVVAKVTRNAQAAVGGREFLLFVREGDRLVCQSSSSLSRAVVEAIDAWANGSPRLLEQSLAIDDVSRLSGLAPLLALDSPLCSLASAPLHSRGEPFGLLVALGGQQRTFLPRDVSVLESYAAPVAIALSNARLYQNERSLAARDPLSGLLNHRSFHDEVETELARCAREQLYSSVVLIDLDAFKSINDADGHAAGDRLLRATARVISETCRREDLAFRVGGDEFALLLPGLIWNEAVVVAKRVCSAIAELNPRIGASAGIACAGPNDCDKDEVLARADARLYAAKRGDVAPLHDGGISTGRGGEPRDRGVR